MPRYELNISCQGEHFARVDFGEIYEHDAIDRANILRMSLGPSYRVMLVRWSAPVGTSVELS